MLRNLWRTLTKPPASISRPEAKHRARLLSGMSLALALLALVGGLTTLLSAGRFSIPLHATTLALLAVYGLSRTQYQRLASILLVVVLGVVPFLSYLGHRAGPSLDARQSLIWIALTVVVTSLFFDVRGIVAVAALNVAGLLLLPALDRQMALLLSSFVIALSGVVAVMQMHRKSVEAERMDVLGLANRELDSLRETLERRVEARTADLANINQALQEQITERERTEVALRDAEARYRTLVEQLPAITYIVEVGSPARTTYISPQVETLLGITPGEWLADPQLWQRQIHDSDRERVLDAVRRAELNGESLNVEYQVLTREGAARWVRNQAVSVNGHADGQRYWHGVMLDITHLKLAEQTLLSSQQRLQFVSWATNDAVWDWEVKSGEVWWNEGMQKLFHYAADDVGRNITWWHGNIHPDDGPKVNRSLRSALDSGQQFWSKEYRFCRADGSYAEVFDRGYIMRDEQGVAVRIIGAMMDITGRKQVEEALREAESKYRTLVEQLPAVVYLAEFGEAGVWHYVSPQIQTLLGFSPQEWMADSGLWFRQIHPDDRDMVMANEAASLRLPGGHQGAIEYRMYARDGRLAWVRDNATVIAGEPGRPPMYHGVLVDITEEKRSQRALQEANDILTQWLKHSEQRSMELGLLNEMSGLLQNCRDIPEACVTVAPILRRLFSDYEIGLYTMDNSHRSPMVAPAWVSEDLFQAVFSPDDCWALRRGQLYVVDEDHPGPVCRHVADPAPQGYMCVPLMAQGEPLALLHLPLAQLELGEEPTRRPMVEAADLQLARTVADGIALALANLRLRESLREQSIRDALTGLFNRRYMEESLEREIHRAARHQSTVGIIMLDLDRFKPFNDTYGHAAGDALLRELGRVLRVNIREADIACRYGGEEFTLILPEASLDVTRRRAEHLRSEVKLIQPELDGRVLPPVTVSLGVATYPNHGTSGEQVVRASDDALYRAKREGRDRVVVAPDGL